jgi:hypothetical protein
LPWIAKSPWLVPELQGFRPHARNIKTFNRAVRHFDRTFLTELTEEQWKHEIDTFLSTMTDSAIETAMRQQPAGIQQFHAEDIARKLKERRKYFRQEMLEYYRFISRIVSIVGSNKHELFTVTKNPDGSVHVVVNKITKDSSVSSKIYDRVFDPKVTKEIRLYGLNDDDRFVVEGGKSPIRIRMIGGSGNDMFVNNGTGGNVIVYDVKFENNIVSGNPGFHNRISMDPQANRYDRLNFKYNYVIPSLAVEFNQDDGLFLGPRAEYFKQGFRKEPYGMRQFLSARGAFKTGSVHFTYEGDYLRAFGNTDLLVRADFKAPVNVTNFFGLGNNTVKDETKDITFYRTKYNIINATAYLRRQPQSWMRINLGPTYQYFYVDSAKNAGKYVTTVVDNNSDPASIYHPQQFLGIDARLDIDSRNNKMLPSRGLLLNAGIRQLWGVNQYSHNLRTVNVDMSIFMSLARSRGLVLATRFGWAANYGHYEFPQAQYLGATDNLRGFRKQRFAGRSMLFNNTEIRVKVADFNTYLFPGSIGLTLFNDVGRVYETGENSNTWHDGYGIGVWVAPIKRIVFSIAFAHSKEENVYPRLTLGFQF